MIQSLTQESSQAGIKLTCGISFLYTWVNHNEQFLQPDCELSEEFKSDCLVCMLFNGKNLTAGADNLLWDNQEWSITNHFIPYSEEEVNAPERFESDAGWYQIRRALKGGTKAETFRQ